MKLTDFLDRACARRMRSASRPRLLLLGIIGFALVAPLLSGAALAAVTGADDPAPVTMAAGVLGGLVLTGPLREEDPGDPSGGGKVTDDDTKVTIGQRLSSALASKASLQATIAQRDATIVDHDATIARITQERDDANAALATANTRIAALEADAAEVEKALKASEAEVGDLKSKETTVEKKAQEKIGSLGFSAAKLPAAQDADADDALPSSRAELEEAMGKLPNLQARADLLNRYEKAQTAAA